MGTSTNIENEEDWCVECSDDELYCSKDSKGQWEPASGDIAELYEKISKGQALTLEWKCPGRRSPSPEKTEDPESLQDSNVVVKEEEKPAAPTEFDFDDVGQDPIFTPRRTPGSAKTPKSSQKRVARMDKIMDDIMRHRKHSGTPHRTPPKFKPKKELG